MPPLRVTRLWRIAGIALIAAIWALSLAPSLPHTGIEHGDKFGHALAYTVLMWWWGQLLSAFRARAMMAVAFSLMGVAIEYAQGASGWRTFDPRDMLANAIGVAMGFALLYTRAGTLLTRIRERTF
jgi:VanZ family protein